MDQAASAGRGATRLRVLIGGVAASSLACTWLALAKIDDLAVQPPAWHLVLAALAFFLADASLLHIRFGDSRHSFTGSEAFVVAGLALVPAPWLVVLAPVPVAVFHLSRARAASKTVFNAALFGTGVALAAVTRAVVGTEGARGWLGLIAASLVFFVWNTVTVSAAVAFSQGFPFIRVLRKGIDLAFLACVGNTSAGLGVVVLVRWQPLLLVGVPPFLVMLFVAYWGHLRAMRERDTWQVLEATSRDLLKLNNELVARVALERAQSLFTAEFVELMLTDGEPGTRASVYRGRRGEPHERNETTPMEVAAGFWPRAFAEREPFEVIAARAPAAQRIELETLGLACCLIAPLVTPQGCIGTLRIGFRGTVDISRHDQQVFATFANQVTAAVHNARLFQTVSEERAKLGGIVDNTSDGIFSIDEHGCVTSWNPAMARITGRPAAEVVGSPLFASLNWATEDGSPVFLEWLHDRLGHSGFGEGLASVETESRQRWLSLAMAAVQMPDEEESLVVVARDVTAVREAEETKRDFVATVSHELRTPLTTLIGFLVTLSRPNVQFAEAEVGEIHQRMLRQARRLERLIEDLLRVAKLDRGEFDIDVQAVSMDEVVDKVVQDFASTTPTRHVELRRAGMASLALADPGRVEQVVANLLSNADRYSPAASEIEVELRRDEHLVVVSVSDRGPGIPADQREAVFERFRRLGDHLTRVSGGSGLGLYIARRLVEAMNGRIWVEARSGGGSTFYFNVPAAPLVAKVRAS